MKNSLQQLGQQLAGIWKQLGMNQRISVALAGVTVLAGLFLLSYWSSRADYSLLYGKLDDAEAARVVAALDEAKIPYAISKTGGAIHVPADKVHQVRMQLASKGIPRGEGVGFEIFDKANFGISDFVQRANYVRAIQGELARTISQLDEVESARVMIVAPENRLLSANQKQPTASVFVRTRGSSALPTASVNSIRFLVANAVEGLAANHVTVVDNKGNVLSEDGDDTMAGLTSTQLAARRNVELYLSKKVEGMLEKVLGPGQAVVRVAADINYDTITRVEEKYDPDSQVMRISTLNDENTDTLLPSSTAAPGASANSGADPNNTNTTTAAASPQIANSRMRKKVTNSQYEINKITSNVLQGAGSLKRVSAAVFIAAKMEGAGPARKAAPRSTDELEKLKKIVQSALGIQVADPARKDEITLEEMPFNDQFAADLTQQLVQSQRTQVGWDLARHLAYPALAIGVLLFFYRLVRRTPVDQFDLGLPPGPGENGKRNPLDWKQPHQPVVTVEVLNRLIRENPDNMTHALRNWMGRSNTPK